MKLSGKVSLTVYKTGLPRSSFSYFVSNDEKVGSDLATKLCRNSLYLVTRLAKNRNNFRNKCNDGNVSDKGLGDRTHTHTSGKSITEEVNTYTNAQLSLFHLPLLLIKAKGADEYVCMMY